MIQVKGLTKSFDGERAVQNIDLTVKKGSIYGLLGSNGAGKTTLLKMLTGIYRPNQGSIHIDDAPVYENDSLKQRVVFIPDALYFFPQSSIKQMAAYYRHFYINWNEERFKKLEQVFQIDPKKKIHRLSKGMQRQVAFWLALSCMPDVLILDEPIDGLDPVMRKKIKNLLFQDVAEREMTVLISSHNLREIEDICDHIGIMHHGKLVIEKELDDLKADTQKIQVALQHPDDEQELLAQLEVLHREKRGSVSLLIVRGHQDDINDTVKPYQPVIFDSLPLTLEEIFIYEMEGHGYEIENILL
ncbi:ABC transporter ATP-binding protein [Desertibacillus haloalkaliphilus]|uniref:ABC transporter ATP-binding protein n=1 Tax=Desertibacillus haloalkaliphilus TaxID=1328930 RepID=UPI001C277675|nr:ABC transporter ATP-binding protein [Desertibacillus haloalkaliphilus]MBU8908844.1 ABC transporter ATP-binding protein [Desertibacillus haloalkaliphilus]